MSEYNADLVSVAEMHIPLDVLPDLIPDASPMSDPSMNSTPAQDVVEKEYFTSITSLKFPLHYELPYGSAACLPSLVPGQQLLATSPTSLDMLALAKGNISSFLRPDTTTSNILSQIRDQQQPLIHIPIKIEEVLGQELNPTNETLNSAPFIPASEGPCFANPTQSFWYCNTTPHITDLFENAIYSEHIKEQYIDFFNHFIIPALGPIPSPEFNWKSNLTHNHSPFEPSWTLFGHNQITPQHQVNFKFEPIGPLAGTDEDPFNQLVPQFFVSALAKSNFCPSINLRWWHHFATKFFVTSAETQRLSKLLPLNNTPPTCFLDFDLPSNEFAPDLKPYLFPHRRALLEGKTNTEVILSAITKLHSPETSLLPAIRNIENCLQSDTSIAIEMMSFSTSTQCIILHLRTQNTSFSHIRQLYTSLSPQSPSSISTIKQTLKLIKQFWEYITGLEGELKLSSSEQTSSFLSFESKVVPGKEWPEIRICFPAWECGVQESGVREGMRNFFLARGWGPSERYEGLNKGLGHEWLSLGFDEERGVDVRISYEPVWRKV